MKIPTHRKHQQFLIAAIAISISIFANPFLHAQEKGAPAKKKKPAPSFIPVEQKPAAQVGILIEYFKLDHRAANKLIRQFAPRASNAQELRDILGEMVKKDEAELIETGWVRSRSGQRSKTESIREDIDPTEYNPPEIPNIVGGIAASETKNQQGQALAEELRNQAKPMIPAIHMTSATPIAFETQNVGLTIEVDPVMEENSKIIDLNLAPEIVTRLADQYFTRPGFEHSARGIENISMPTFHTMIDTTQIKAIPGNYNLFGIHTPHDDPAKRIIILLKADLFLAK